MSTVPSSSYNKSADQADSGIVSRTRNLGVFSGQHAGGGPGGYGDPGASGAGAAGDQYGSGVGPAASGAGIGPSVQHVSGAHGLGTGIGAGAAGLGAGSRGYAAAPVASGQAVNYGYSQQNVPAGCVPVSSVHNNAALVPMAGVAPVGGGYDHNRDVGSTIFLRPLAPPFALGLASYWAGSWIFFTWLAGWYGGPTSHFWFWPFLFFFGGVAQFTCAIKSFWARDALATVWLGTWSSFFLAFAIWSLMVSIGVVPLENIYGHQPELGMWFVVLLALTIICMISALARDMVLFLMKFLAFIATLLIFIGFFVHSTGVIRAGAYFGIFSAIVALYRSFAYLVWENFGPFLPVMRSPVTLASPAVKIPYGEPGVKHGN